MDFARFFGRGLTSADAREPASRLLIVSANRRHLALYARRLSQSGRHGAVTADTIDRAMAELHRRSVDLVLADVRIGTASGVELVRRMRRNPALRDIPFFMVTGRSDSAGKVDAYRGGADGIVAKPFDFDVLEARIAREIERAGALCQLHRDKAMLDARVASRAIELGEMRDRWLSSERERQRLAGLVRPAA